MLFNLLSTTLSALAYLVQATPLTLAAERGHADTVELLLAQKADFALQQVWQ